MGSNEKGFDTYLVNALAARGVTIEQHETKMANLTKLSAGGRVIKALSHDCYLVAGRADTYNPYTDTWERR